MLPGELRLLLLLVPVLPVVHDPGDRRIRLSRDLDQVEVLREGVVEGFLRLLDPDLRAVFVDEPDSRDPDRVVDPSLLLDRAYGLDLPPRPQRALTKLIAPPLSNVGTTPSSGPVILVVRLGSNPR